MNPERMRNIQDPKRIQEREKEAQTREDAARIEVQKASIALAEVQFFLGLSRYEEGKYDEAADSFAQAALHTPHAYVYDWLGMSLARAGKFDEAERAYKLALERCNMIPADKSPDLPSVLKNYADLLLHLGRTEEAKALEDRRSTISPPITEKSIPRKGNPVSRLLSRLKHAILGNR